MANRWCSTSCSTGSQIPRSPALRSSPGDCTTAVTDPSSSRHREPDDGRADEARTLVAALLPDAVLEDDDVRELAELLADVDDESLPSPSASAPDDAALAEALEQVVREREQQWVDEPVPMLGGLTPRAAADPIGRVDLDRLLRQYEGRSGTPGTFDVARLRQLLDLP